MTRRSWLPLAIGAIRIIFLIYTSQYHWQNNHNTTPLKLSVDVHVLCAIYVYFLNYYYNFVFCACTGVNK